MVSDLFSVVPMRLVFVDKKSLGVNDINTFWMYIEYSSNQLVYDIFLGAALMFWCSPFTIILGGTPC